MTALDILLPLIQSSARNPLNTSQNAHLDSSNISETSKYLFSSVSLSENEKSDQDMSEESGRMTDIPTLFLASPKVPSKSKYILTNKKERLDFDKEASLHHTKPNYLQQTILILLVT
ncbi:hypothetical protein AVEN_5814-1 [Araneus ventricosus]|uniref:Uncharacterized protein n=1 Tax=Araneus ventricosus TaxID=182803 RepID=A0A4Y2R754_ARAVE|nr:hypothetical protein AVEN_5814-1 [Araneus ventricosus]